MATIKEVAELAEVSQATVSRVLNGNSRVSPLKQERVLAAMEQLGYRPNAFAQSLATNRSYSTGMVVGSLGGPFYGEIMHQVEVVMKSARQHLIVTSGHDHEAEELDAVNFLQERRCDALILHVNQLADDFLLQLHQQGTPLVILNRLIDPLADSCIWLDNEKGGYLATRHLLEQGHRQIACISGPADKVDSNQRVAGYRKALAEAGVEWQADWLVEGSFEEGASVRAAQHLLRQAPECTALFACNDFIALAAIEVYESHGIQVPEQLSVVGFDDILVARYANPRLTTVHFPVREMGQRAGQLALRKIQGMPGTAYSGCLQPFLVVRESVKPHACSG